MEPAERDDLRRDLEAAGCPALANAVTEWPHLMTAELPELRSLLRREERQPVTEAGMREAGFRRLKPGLPAWSLRIGSGRIVRNVAGEFRLDTGEDCIPLHITDMQHLNAVIAALRGQAGVKDSFTTEGGAIDA